MESMLLAVKESDLSRRVVTNILPELFLRDNTNLINTLAGANPEKGNLRETFFLNQVSVRHDVKLPLAGDFLVDEKFIFEIGGESKSAKQLFGQENILFKFACARVEYNWIRKNFSILP